MVLERQYCVVSAGGVVTVPAMSAGQMFFAAVAWFSSVWLPGWLPGAQTRPESHIMTQWRPCGLRAAPLQTAGMGWKERISLHLSCDVVTLISRSSTEGDGLQHMLHGNLVALESFLLFVLLFFSHLHKSQV